MGCVTAPAKVQKPALSVNSWLPSSAAIPASAVSVMFGRRFATAIPIWALAACRFSSAWRTSGRCSTSCAGRLSGNSCGNCKLESSNSSAGGWLGKPPESAASRSRCWASCLSSGGSVAATCASCDSCAATFEPAGITLRKLLAQDFEHVGVDRDEFVRRGNLRPQGRLLDRRGGHVGAQRDMRRRQGKARLFRLRLQGLHGPPIQAEHVRHVRHADLRSIQIEIELVGVGDGRKLARGLLAARGETGRDAGIVGAFLRQHVLPRHGQRGLRRLDVRVGLERALDQIVQRLRVKEGPPFSRNVLSAEKALRLAAGDVGFARRSSPPAGSAYSR